VSVTVPTQVRRRTPGHRHFADRAVTSPTTPPISVFIDDDGLIGRMDDGQQLIEMATAWPMSATVVSVSQVFAASRVSTRPAAARVARSGWSPGGGGPAAVGVVVMF
jgi:hypothetical protein